MNAIIMSNSFFGWIGATMSMVSFITPIIPFMRSLRKEVNISLIPIKLLVLILLNSLVLMSYGALTQQLPLLMTSMAGVSVTSIWIGLFLVFYAQAKLIPSLISIIIFLSSMGELFYCITSIIGEDNLLLIKASVVAFHLIKYLGLFLHFSKLIKTKQLTPLSFIFLISELFNCLIWLGYSLSTGDAPLIISFIIGLLLSTVILIKARQTPEAKSSTSIDSHLFLSKGELAITTEAKANSPNEAINDSSAIIISINSH